MQCKGCQDRDNKIRLLEQANRDLSIKLEELLQHQTMLSGIKGEKLILGIVKGTTTGRGAPHDIRLDNGGKVEVKYSRVTEPKPGTSTRRWVWNGVIGERDAKDYDVLVLIGDKDGKFHTIKEDGSSFVYFILNKDDIRKIMVPGGRRGWVALNVNPTTTRSQYSKQLWKYKVTAKQAKDLFDQLVV